jgi:hypothetical protein
MAKKRKTIPVKETPVNEVERSRDALLQIRNLTAEFFDHAIILVSREVEGETEFLNTSLGNQFAVKGMLNVFMNEYINDNLEDVECEIDEDDNECEIS